MSASIHHPSTRHLKPVKTGWFHLRTAGADEVLDADAAARRHIMRRRTVGLVLNLVNVAVLVFLGFAFQHVGPEGFLALGFSFVFGAALWLAAIFTQVLEAFDKVECKSALVYINLSLIVLMPFIELLCITGH
ncbi:MAG: hypothetical protein ACREJ2_05625 [Planctomycetota bacterium]